MSLLWRPRRSKESPDPQAQPVLVVEDDPGVRAYLVAVLEHAGYSVIAAGSGEEGLQLLGKKAPKLAVLDIGLPGMDGFAVADRLSSSEVPVIMVTGEPERAAGRGAGMRVMTKPVSPDDLERAVQESL
jgi:DNA-binding response OmpR family regulator